MIYTVVRAIIRLLIPTQMRLRVSGADRCPDEGPLIVVANHLGLLDPIVAAVQVRRRVHILAKAEIFAWPVLGGIARGCGVVPVRRGASDREALRALLEVLRAGGCVLLMPEGTFPKVPLPAAMLRAQPGAAFLAAHSGAPVLPVGVAGTEAVWSPRRGWRFGQRPRVTINYGEPYAPDVAAAGGAKAAFERVADDMGRRIAALLPAAYRGYYSEDAQGAALGAGLADEQRLGQHADLE
ncbi:MAG TPA: lysophospholipid acyltransferase family protein [Ktedonobacterales bacterium]|nr:lysophospholipid acyltransferase family protein [Ktedonobacterales bacterium]